MVRVYGTIRRDAAGPWLPCVGSRTRSVLCLQIATFIRALLCSFLCCLFLRGGIGSSRFPWLERLFLFRLLFRLLGQRCRCRCVDLLCPSLVHVLVLACRDERVRKRQRHRGRAARGAFSDRAMLHCCLQEKGP